MDYGCAAPAAPPPRSGSPRHPGGYCSSSRSVAAIALVPSELRTSNLVLNVRCFTRATFATSSLIALYGVRPNRSTISFMVALYL